MIAKLFFLIWIFLKKHFSMTEYYFKVSLKILGTQGISGRPRIESQQPGILSAILDIVSHGSLSHEKRQIDLLRCVSTLNDLKLKLEERGFTIKRGALYLRVLPKRIDSVEGRRHVITVPVKLLKPRNVFHVSHKDTQFAIANNRFVEELASLLGPNEVIYLSTDDKSRVPLGITAANKQSTILMHYEYRVTLPDHDFVKAERHKLIPSVTAGITIKPNCFGDPSAVTHSGPTYVAIRSGKHDSSTALTHGFDFETILNLPDFESITKFEGKLKPVAIIATDGGPDENCR